MIKKNLENIEDERMPLGRRNYILILSGLGLIIAGFLLMAGGGSDDPTVFNERMFSFRRITLAPIVVMAGFALEIYAIMSRRGPKNSPSSLKNSPDTSKPGPPKSPNPTPNSGQKPGPQNTPKPAPQNAIL